MKVTMTGTMNHEGKEIHFLTLKRDGFVYELWPSPFNDEDIGYTVTKEGETEPLEIGKIPK